MSMHFASRRFDAAPWPTVLKVMSLLGTIALAITTVGAYRAAPAIPGFTRSFGLGVALIPLLLLFACLLFVVRGFTLDREELAIERLLWTTRLPLAGLTRASVDPGISKGSLRLVGNGGLFSFTGWFYHRRIGRYRLFATDLRYAVVLRFGRRVVVVSPAAPQAFVEHLRHLIPHLETAPEERRG